MKHSSDWKAIRAAALTRFRAMSYEALTRLVGTSETSEVRSDSGTTYSVQVDVFWDDRPNGPVRVMAMIDDGGITAFMPKSDDFIMTPNGDLMGERPRTL